jgi:hypothetical protein
LMGFSELSELLTLPPGVGVCVCGPRAFSGSRPPATPLIVGICDPGPDDDVISLVAGGSALGGCCLFFFPKRNDMATGVRRLRLQRWTDSGQTRIRSAIASRKFGWSGGNARERGRPKAGELLRVLEAEWTIINRACACLRRQAGGERKTKDTTKAEWKEAGAGRW